MRATVVVLFALVVVSVFDDMHANSVENRMVCSKLCSVVKKPPLLKSQTIAFVICKRLCSLMGKKSKKRKTV